MKYIIMLLLLFSFSCDDGKAEPFPSQEEIEKKAIEAIKADTIILIPGPPAEPPPPMYNDTWKLQDINPDSKDFNKVFNLNKFKGQKIVMVFHSAP